jgi:nucleotide-binding universal stress UspA family protein
MTEIQRGADFRAVRAQQARPERSERAEPAHPDAQSAADGGGGRAVAGDGPAAEAAVAYAQDLGWPLTPGYAVEGGLCTCGRTPCLESGAHPVPGAWRVASCATPTLVRVVWRMCTGAPVLAVLGRAVPGAARLGAVQAPALIGVAALELLSKRAAAQGPVVDGYGRISFLVDLGSDERRAAHDEEEEFGRWRRAGMDLTVLGGGEERTYVPLPTPGHSGRSGVVWAVAPVAGRALPPLTAVAEVFDRAVRSTYPSLWSTVHAGWF